MLRMLVVIALAGLLVQGDSLAQSEEPCFSGTMTWNSAKIEETGYTLFQLRYINKTNGEIQSYRNPSEAYSVRMNNIHIGHCGFGEWGYELRFSKYVQGEAPDWTPWLEFKVVTITAATTRPESPVLVEEHQGRDFKL